MNTGLGEAPPAEPTPVEPAPSAPVTPLPVPPMPAPTEPSTLTARLYASTGELREDYGAVLEEAGLGEHASFFQRNNKIDNAVKAGLNATKLIGKKISDFSPDEIAGMPPEARQSLLGKLNQAPETPDGYQFEGEKFEGVHPEAGTFWGETLKEAGLSQAQVETLFPKMVEWQEKLTADQQSFMEAGQAESIEANTSHFQAEWGDDYIVNKTLVEAQAGKDLDSENPAHVAFLKTKEGIQIMHERAVSQARALGEGSYPKGGPQQQGERPADELSRLQRETPNWREVPAVKERMETLAKIVKRQSS